MWIPHGLRNAIIDFLLSLPGIHNQETLRALILSANLDSNILNQLKFNISTMDFFQNYISLALDYGANSDGRHAIESVLLESKKRVGQEGNIVCDKLLTHLRGYLNKQQQYQLITQKLSQLYEQYENEIDSRKRHGIEKTLEQTEEERYNIEKEAFLLSVIHASIIEDRPFPRLGFTIRNKSDVAQYITQCNIIIQHQVVVIEMMAPQNKILEPIVTWDIHLPFTQDLNNFVLFNYKPPRVIQVGTDEPAVIDMRFSLKDGTNTFPFDSSNYYKIKATFITDEGREFSSGLIRI